MFDSSRPTALGDKPRNAERARGNDVLSEAKHGKRAKKYIYTRYQVCSFLVLPPAGVSGFLFCDIIAPVLCPLAPVILVTIGRVMR